MKRVITTLAILLVVVVAGMTALVLLVNPNDFRAYMVRQVEQRSGYQLTLNGELRWHVWPQLSILSGPVSLSAPGAAQPLVSAENMRLDVNLLPLLSHQLSVKQVMLKGAVVRLIPESASQRPADAPIGPTGQGNPAAVNEVARGWKFDIAHLRIADSLLIWQQSSGNQLNVRDFNLSLDQTEPRQVSMELSSRLNRDQRELQLHLSSTLDITDYPRQINATIDRLEYQLQGAELPPQGVKGQAAMKASWRSHDNSFSLSNISLDANDSQLSGKLSGTLGVRPQLVAELNAANLDLDSLMGLAGSVGKNGEVQPERALRLPVISQGDLADNADSPLNALDGELTMNIDRLRWRNVEMNAVQLQAASRQGLLTVNRLTGQAGSGSFSLPGTVDVRSAETKVSLKPQLRSIALSPLLSAFDLPAKVSGELSLDGTFSGVGLTVAAFKRQWWGRADITLANGQIAGLNFQQLVQRAVTEQSDKVHGEPADNQSNLQQIAGHATLERGLVDFIVLNARSVLLNYTGSGSLDLLKKQLDMTFGVTVTQGWRGDSALVQRLRQTPVPLRIYGPWSMINYSLKVDQVLRQQLRDEAKQRLKEWVARNPAQSN